jgi:hypothetical protein
VVRQEQTDNKQEQIDEDGFPICALFTPPPKERCCEQPPYTVETIDPAHKGGIASRLISGESQGINEHALYLFGGFVWCGGDPREVVPR